MPGVTPELLLYPDDDIVIVVATNAGEARRDVSELLLAVRDGIGMSSQIDELRRMPNSDPNFGTWTGT